MSLVRLPACVGFRGGEEGRALTLLGHDDNLATPKVSENEVNEIGAQKTTDFVEWSGDLPTQRV